MDEDQKFEEIVNRGMEEYLKRNPRIAVRLGKEEYEKIVEPGTKKHLVNNLKWFSNWINELKQLNIEKLTFENQISLKAMEYYHNINSFMHEAFPLWKKIPNGLEYFQEIIFLLFQRKGPVTSVAEAIIAHLTHLPIYLEEFQSRFDDESIPIVWRDLALEQVKTTPKFFLTLANAFKDISEVSDTLKDKLQNAFEEAELVIQTHIEWIKNLPIDENEFAWAIGPEKLNKLFNLRKLPWDRETILKKGKDAFNSLFKRIKQLAKEIDRNKSLTEVIKEVLKKDKIPTFQEVLEHARNESKRAKKFIKSHDLASIPQESLVIIETPPHLMHIIPTAAYNEAPYFHRDQPGIYMISPVQNEEDSMGHSYTMTSNAMVHEAYPGHHLDFACNNEYAPIPRLFDFALETVEGWAHYCEEMMLRKGFYKNSKIAERFILGDQLFRAMRVMLDIQLHSRQRKVDDAIKMLMNVLAMDENAAKAEVLRYTSNPGYNISYLIGKLLIEDLQQEVEEKMGNKFSLKFFHDTILKSGDLPYYLLKEYFNEIIKKSE
ncbi:MAG: DUF885 domain-containing protein [Candidatus Lokiarchaeota archaeon]|nr:DUF885 domain-containing protein [Candidatus Lokiarchaeota archaeon]